MRIAIRKEKEREGGKSKGNKVSKVVVRVQGELSYHNHSHAVTSCQVQLTGPEVNA